MTVLQEIQCYSLYYVINTALEYVRKKGVTSTVRCRYNAVNFVTNIHRGHPIARPLGRGMGCLVWSQHLTDILPQFL